MLVKDLFHQVGMILKESSDYTEYLLDSFPVPMCDNIRIFNAKLISSEQYRGYIASKKRYFYGVRVQLLTTKDGIPVEFVILPGSASDMRGLNALQKRQMAEGRWQKVKSINKNFSSYLKPQ